MQKELHVATEVAKRALETIPHVSLATPRDRVRFLTGQSSKVEFLKAQDGAWRAFVKEMEKRFLPEGVDQIPINPMPPIEQVREMYNKYAALFTSMSVRNTARHGTGYTSWPMIYILYRRGKKRFQTMDNAQSYLQYMLNDKRNIPNSDDGVQTSASSSDVVFGKCAPILTEVRSRMKATTNLWADKTCGQVLKRRHLIRDKFANILASQKRTDSDAT